MLDDLKYIHSKDAQDALGVAQKQTQQYRHKFNLSWRPAEPIHEIIVAGMGGSGLGARAFKVWPGVDVPYEIIQDYDLPKRAGRHTLLICFSYSGNTEEILSVFEQAVESDAFADHRPQTVVIAAGGQLVEKAKQHNLPLITVPTGYQPRMTFGFLYKALIELMEQTPLLDGTSQQLNSAADWLDDQIQNWSPDVPTSQNYAKQIAMELMGKSVVVYAGPKLFPGAYKWKISINENAKNVAWVEPYPEFSHNEFIGWSSHPVEKPYAVVDLRSKLEHPQVQKRFIVTERLLSGKRPAPVVVEAQGQSHIEQLLWTIALGDFVSIYLALLNGLNPTPVDLIEKLKSALSE